MQMNARLAPHDAVDGKVVILVVHFGDEQLRGSERCIFNHLKAIDSRVYRVVLWTNHKALAELSAAIPIEVVIADFYPPIGFNYARKDRGALSVYAGLLAQTWRLLRNIRPQLIVCNSLAPCQWMVPVSLVLNIPLLAYLHTDYLPKSRLLSLAFGATQLVGVSAFTLTKFLDDGFPSSQTHVVLNGVDDLAQVDSDRAGMRAEFGLADDTFVILSICALVDWKKVALIIASFSKLVSGPGARAVLVITGDGPERERLELLANGLHVIFTGWRSDVANIYAMSDCIVLASEREAFGLTVIEAGAMGKPVIAARAGGPMEIIQDGVGGLFAQPGSVESFAAAMQTLRDAPSLRADMGANARQAFDRKYRVEHMTRAMSSVFDETLRQRRGSVTTRLQRFGQLVYLTCCLIFRKARGRAS